MRELEKILLEDPYSMDKQNKDIFFKNYINKLTIHHYNNSKEYKKLINHLSYAIKKKMKLIKSHFYQLDFLKN